MFKKNYFIFLFLIGITILFFYPTFFLFKIPFPGDLLIGEYSPWKYAPLLGYAPGAYPNKAQYFDVIRQIYPWTSLAIKTIMHGQFPLWNPYDFSGAPLFANSQSAVLYPLHILYFLLPQYIAWTILIILQPLLASIFTYLYARKIGIRKWGALLSSICFSYCLFSSVFLEYNTIGHVIVFLPLLLLLVEIILNKPRFFPIIAFTFSFAFADLAGHIQLFGFTAFFVFLYWCVRLGSQKEKIKKAILFACLFVLGFGIASIQLLPTVELIQHAARVAQDYHFLIDKLLLQPSQLILFLSPDIFGNPATRNYLLSDSYPGNAIYIGSIPILFAFWGVVRKRGNYFVRFFTLAAVVLLLLFVNTPFTQAIYRFQIPLFSTGSPTNGIFLLSFCLALLAGFGLESYLTEEKKGMIYIALGGVLLLCLGIILFKVAHIPISIKNATYSLAILLIGAIGIILSTIRFKRKSIFVVILILLVVIDLAYFFEKFNPFVPKEAIYPPVSIFNFLQRQKGTDRFWTYGNGFIESNFATQYNLYDPNGYDPLYPKVYGEFLQSSYNGRIPTTFTDQTRSDALIAPGFGKEDLSKNIYRQKVLNLLGVKYILDRFENASTGETFPPSEYRLLYNQDGWRIFENRNALPRAFVVFSYQKYSNAKEFSNLFYSDTFNPRSTILLNNTISGLSNGQGEASIVEYNPNIVKIRVHATATGLLFLSDTYYPGWQVTVDGKDEPILNADYAFRAVKVASGNHTVLFSYQPASFSFGLTLTIISIVLSIILGFFSAKHLNKV